KFSVALQSVWELISRTNKYIDETEPWKLAKDETKKDRLGNVMAHLAESLRVTAVLLQPFLTEAPSAIFYQLGIEKEDLQSWESIYERQSIPAGTKVNKDKPIFPRLERDEEIDKVKNMMTSTVSEEDVTEDRKQGASYDDFMKLDM